MLATSFTFDLVILFLYASNYKQFKFHIMKLRSKKKTIKIIKTSSRENNYNLMKKNKKKTI
jgi:hypothetical protein